ncbi:MAG: ATP-binding protein, partial [Ignavibacteriaceae bacterium]|nr:ATP-binding protein [Ignavibacteriaceae bacterium]
MKIVRSTIDKLGVKLYDKASAVLAELIANSYDADAKSVKVKIPIGEWLASRIKDGTFVDKEGRTRTKWKNVDRGFEIIVEDDGCGMTPDEMQNFYLNVGMDRREDINRGSLSKKYKRKVMGRKGVGKLAPFGICKEMEIISSGGTDTGKGYFTSHIILKYDDIVEDTSKDYKPIIGSFDESYQPNSGTKIILRIFDYRHIPDKNMLNRQISRRFGLESRNWKVEISDSQKDDKFTIGQFDDLNEKMDGTLTNLDDKFIVIDEINYPVKGWVAYSKEPYKDEEMAGIRIYARGKLFATTRDFGLKAGFTGEHTIRSYLFGAMYLDWLDDDEEDVAKTDRQDILWDSSEKCIALREFGQQIIKELGAKPFHSIRKRVWEIFEKKSHINEIVEKRYHGNPEFKTQILQAAKVFANKTSLDEISDDNSIQEILDLALLVGPNKVLVDKLNEIGDDKSKPIETLIKLFEITGFAELANLGQIADKRVKAIEKLKSSVNATTDERALQELLEEAPWLINFEWTPLTMNQRLNTTREKFESWHEEHYGKKVLTSTIEDKTKRPDFVMLSFVNIIYIVEIKKTKYKINDSEFDNIVTYFNALKKFLKDHPHISDNFTGGIQIILVAD